MWRIFCPILLRTQQNIMSIGMDLFCFTVSFTMLFASVWPVATIIGGCGWHIHYRAVRMDVAFWHFSNNPPNSVSVADSIIFLMILHSTRTGRFSRGIDFIGELFLDLETRKNINILCCVPLVMRCGIHLNIYVGSYRFFYILSLFLNVIHCNSITVWFVLLILVLEESVPPPGS